MFNDVPLGKAILYSGLRNELTTKRAKTTRFKQKPQLEQNIYRKINVKSKDD
jgi:hypothetical protein